MHGRMFCRLIVHQTRLRSTSHSSTDYSVLLCHEQEWKSAIEPSLWPARLYGTVYLQQLVKLTACNRLSASSRHICLRWLFICFQKPVRCREGRAYNNLHLLTYLLTYLQGCQQHRAKIRDTMGYPPFTPFSFPHISPPLPSSPFPLEEGTLRKSLTHRPTRVCGSMISWELTYHSSYILA